MSVPPPAPLHAVRSPGRWLPRAIFLCERRLLALLIALFLLRDLPWRLDEYDQAKQAFTSLEMIDTGSWWFEHLPGYRGLATKPPLAGWLSAAVYELSGGNWEIAWRLPSLLAAVALVVLLWRAGEQIRPGGGGGLAAAAFGFNLLTPRLAMLVRTDTLLTLWITLLGLLVWRHVRPGAPAWTPRARWAVFGLMVVTMMTKGPIVYAFLLPGMLVHWWVGHRGGEPAAALWGGWWPWTLPLLPFALWVERGIVTVPGFYEQVVAHEFLGRFTLGEQAVHHNQAVYFYVAQLAKQWLPWSVLLAAAGIRARGIWKPLWREPGTRWLLCWAAGGLIALSLVPSKRTDRVYPAVPALCLVLAAVLAAARKQAETAAAATPRTQGTAPSGKPWPARWESWAIPAAVVLSTAAAGQAVAAAYWYKAGSHAAFGARVLADPGARRCELVVGKGWDADDESMLLYLRKLRYLRTAAAVQLASTGQLDAIVIDEEGLARERAGDDPLGAYFPARPERVSAGIPPRFELCVKPAATPPRTAPSAPVSASRHPSPRPVHH